MERKLGDMPRYEEIMAIEYEARRLRAEVVRNGFARLLRWVGGVMGRKNQPTGAARA